jgi:hypothetical protein
MPTISLTLEPETSINWLSPKALVADGRSFRCRFGHTGGLPAGRGPLIQKAASAAAALVRGTHAAGQAISRQAVNLATSITRGTFYVATGLTAAVHLPG